MTGVDRNKQETQYGHYRITEYGPSGSLLYDTTESKFYLAHC